VPPQVPVLQPTVAGRSAAERAAVR